MYLSCLVLLDPVTQEEIQHRFKSSMVRHIFETEYEEFFRCGLSYRYNRSAAYTYY